MLPPPLLPLPPNPSACRPLTDPDLRRLRSQDATWWANPDKSCLTCDKQSPFKVVTLTGESLVACDCRAQWLLHHWLSNAGIGEWYQRLTWLDAAWVDERAMAAVRVYSTEIKLNLNLGYGLTLWSPNVGTGKTLLATLLLKKLLAMGVDGYFIQFNELLDVFTSTWRDKAERDWFIRRVRNAGVLVVDDIGRENKGRQQVSEAMFDTVIRHRVADAKPTIITTNFTPAALQQGYGFNIVSLLASVNDQVEVPGVDYRRKATPEVERDRVRRGFRRPFSIGAP